MLLVLTVTNSFIPFAATMVVHTGSVGPSALHFSFRPLAVRRSGLGPVQLGACRGQGWGLGPFIPMCEGRGTLDDEEEAGAKYLVEDYAWHRVMR